MFSRRSFFEGLAAFVALAAVPFKVKAEPQLNPNFQPPWLDSYRKFVQTPHGERIINDTPVDMDEKEKAYLEDYFKSERYAKAARDQLERDQTVEPILGLHRDEIVVVRDGLVGKKRQNLTLRRHIKNALEASRS